jgi:hypothetical protein
VSSDGNDGHSQDHIHCLGRSAIFCIEQSRSPGDAQLTLPIEVQYRRRCYDRKQYCVSRLRLLLEWQWLAIPAMRRV